MKQQFSARRLAFALGMVVAVVCVTGLVRADVVYQANFQEANYVPFGEDGTPGRPVPGDMLGNTITLDGTNRTLTRITIPVALNNLAGAPDPATDDYTVDLYLNDGAIDPASGLMQPGTLIGSATTTVTMPPFSQSTVFDFSGLGLVVPDSFTVIISSTHPTTTFFGPAGVPGPFSSGTAPRVGSGPNTMWYTSAASGWETNSTWAIDDGASTNYMFMTVECDP